MFDFHKLPFNKQASGRLEPRYRTNQYKTNSTTPRSQPRTYASVAHVTFKIYLDNPFHVSSINDLVYKMSKPLILFFSRVRHALTAYKALSAYARTELVTSTNRQNFFKDIEGKYRDAVAIYRTSASGVVSPHHMSTCMTDAY
jgi:hypothetical protein